MDEGAADGFRGDPHFETIASELIQEVTTHVKDEEGRLVLALLKACPQDWAVSPALAWLPSWRGV